MCRILTLCLLPFLLLNLNGQTGSTVPEKFKSGAAAKPRNVTVTMREGLRFDPPRFETSPGQEVVITLENADTTHQQHNFVVVKPGTREQVAAAALTLGDKSLELGFVPPGLGVLASSPLLDAEKTATVRLRMPAEPGIYPYVCTFPGHSAVMFGAIYSGVKPGPLRTDPHIPAYAAQSGLAGGGKRPFVQRMFVSGASPAAIAVALPGTQNYVWDASQCRLRFVWEGAFIDAAAHWAGKGADRAEVPAAPWWTTGPDETPARLAWPQLPAGPPQFLGYRTTPEGPVFRYRVGSTEIQEAFSAVSGQSAIRLTVSTPAGPRGSTLLQKKQP